MIIDFSTYITEAELQKQLRSTTTFELGQILPHLQDAAETYLYNALSHEFVESVVDGTEADDTVKDLLKFALVNFAGVLYADRGLLNISSSGIYENADADSKPVRLEVLQNFKSSCLRSGSSKLELLLKYLEKNAKATTPEKFKIWLDSEAYTVFTETPIHSLTDFQKFLYLHNSRVAFLALRPYLTQAYETDIQPLLLKLGNTTVSTAQRNLITSNLNRALCHFAYAYGINDLAITLGEGVFTYNNTNANRQSASYLTAEQNRIDANRQEKLQMARAICERIDNVIDGLININQVAVPFVNDAASHIYYTGCSE
jgi:hypothetical protein